MLNGAPPPEETLEVLLKIHLRILFSPEEKKTNSGLPKIFFIFFYFYYNLFYPGGWAINKLDQDRLEAVMLASEWGKDLVSKDVSAEAAVQKLVRTVTAACDATIPR